MIIDRPTPKTSAERQAQYRVAQRGMGRSEMRIWVTPEEREAIKLALRDIRANKLYDAAAREVT